MREPQEELLPETDTDDIVAVLMQFTLGVVTILTQVHLAMGILHQFGALLLLSALLKALHVTGRPTPA